MCGARRRHRPLEVRCRSSPAVFSSGIPEWKRIAATRFDRSSTGVRQLSFGSEITGHGRPCWSTASPPFGLGARVSSVRARRRRPGRPCRTGSARGDGTRTRRFPDRAPGTSSSAVVAADATDTSPGTGGCDASFPFSWRACTSASPMMNSCPIGSRFTSTNSMVCAVARGSCWCERAAVHPDLHRDRSGAEHTAALLRCRRAGRSPTPAPRSDRQQHHPGRHHANRDRCREPTCP